MPESHADLESEAEYDASSATFTSSHVDDPDAPWEVELPQIQLQADFEAIIDLLTDWALEQRFGFVKARSWQDRAGQTYRVKLICDRACEGGRIRRSRAHTRNTSSSKQAPA